MSSDNIPFRGVKRPLFIQDFSGYRQFPQVMQKTRSVNIALLFFVPAQAFRQILHSFRHRTGMARRKQTLLVDKIGKSGRQLIRKAKFQIPGCGKAPISRTHQEIQGNFLQIRLLQVQGAKDIVACDRQGTLHRGRTYADQARQWIAETTNQGQFVGSLAEALRGADVFVGVSGPYLLTGDDIATMAPGAIVFALANPDPEVDPADAAPYAAVVATGRSDYPNQINNVLAFPGFFRGMLNGGASEITDAHLLAASDAIADAVGPEELNPGYIVPSVFDPRVSIAVADAVEAAVKAGEASWQ